MKYSHKLLHKNFQNRFFFFNLYNVPILGGNCKTFGKPFIISVSNLNGKRFYKKWVSEKGIIFLQEGFPFKAMKDLVFPAMRDFLPSNVVKKCEK